MTMLGFPVDRIAALVFLGVWAACSARLYYELQGGEGSDHSLGLATGALMFGAAAAVVLIASGVLLFVIIAIAIGAVR